MTKQLLLLLLSCMWVFTSTSACDSCGCAASGNGIGLISAFRYHFVSTRWYTTQFETLPTHGNAAQDDFWVAELAIRYHLSDRWKILANQPYRIHQRQQNEALQSIDGLGDTRLLASYSIINNEQLNEDTRLFWEVGGGAKLPLGSYDPQLHEQDLPENFNIGNGSWAGIVQSNALLMYRNWGAVANTNIQLNATTPEGYRFGHQWTAQLAGFYQIEAFKNQGALTPIAGVYGELVNQDRFANDNVVAGTGGQGIFASTGVNITYNDWMIGASAALPIAQNYSAGEVVAHQRWSFQLTYIFY